jgi:predicted ATPase
MRLESFQVKNFRSITDSGIIDVSRITALLGRNESGKSNLLRALESLNPAEGFAALNATKDFPRHRHLDECTDETEVLWTWWELDEAERSELVVLFPRAVAVTHVTITRGYRDKSRRVGFIDLPVLSVDMAGVKAKVRKITPAVSVTADSLEDPAKSALLLAAQDFEQKVINDLKPKAWAEIAAPALSNLRKALVLSGADLSEKAELLVIELEDQAASVINEDKAAQAARLWALEQLPIFILFEDYPELNGHQNIPEYLASKAQARISDADRHFEKLCKVAGLKPQQLQDLLNDNDQETRNQLVNRAGSVVTGEIRRLWRDRSLKIRFNLDGPHLDTLISDPTSTYDVEVNLNDRSRGLQWFFSFYITFSADTDGGDAQDAILLLDEPGLYLHAKSQSDLLRHFETDFSNQILYTTHSPFMVPTHALDSIRTVNIAENSGTTVTNDPSGDSRTLFPLQAALGYDLAQSLFVGPNNLIVEGVTDFWFLSAISQYLKDQNGISLDQELTITPAGGAQKIPYLVALLSSEQLHVLVLLDQEKDSLATKDELVKSKLILDGCVTFVTEAFNKNIPAEADIEDLLEPSIYIDLVMQSYARELKKKTLKLNTNIPRIAKRVELALRELDIEFHKTRPARLFLTQMATTAENLIDVGTRERFEKLFGTLNDRFAAARAKRAM